MKILQLAASSVLALLILSGCSAGHDYWGNRLDDAKDIFTFTAGGGFGVKVQVGPVQADMYNYASLTVCAAEKFSTERIRILRNIM